MGVNDGMPVYYSPAEFHLRGTDHLHRTHEQEDVDSNSKKT